MITPLGKTIVEVASTHLGEHEHGHNRGALIDAWMMRLGLRPEDEHPWCAAFAWCMVDDACKLMGQKNPLPPSAKVLRLYQRATVLGLTSPTPLIGSIACHVVTLHDALSPGHCGIVDSIAGDHVVNIEGNTNAAGAREGTAVARHIRRLDWVNLGYVVIPSPA